MEGITTSPAAPGVGLFQLAAAGLVVGFTAKLGVELGDRVSRLAFAPLDGHIDSLAEKIGGRTKPLIVSIPDGVVAKQDTQALGALIGQLQGMAQAAKEQLQQQPAQAIEVAPAEAAPAEAAPLPVESAPAGKAKVKAH